MSLDCVINLCYVTAFSNSRAKYTKNYYVSEKVYGDLTWFDALMVCNLKSMHLYSPQADTENTQFLELLGKSNYTGTIAFGGSQRGSENFWYEINNGRHLHFRLPEGKTSWSQSELCLRLKQADGKYEYQSYACDAPSDHFVCETVDFTEY